MKKDPVQIAIKFFTTDLMSAFKLGLEEGLLHQLPDRQEIDNMTEECFQVYRQGYVYGIDLYIKSMEKQCTKLDS